LFLPDQRILVGRLGFEDEERGAFDIEEQEIDVAPRGLLEVVSERVQIVLAQSDAMFEADVGGAVFVLEETPPGLLEQLVDFDAGGRFVLRQSSSRSA
jgi:hypothetical protein